MKFSKRIATVCFTSQLAILAGCTSTSYETTDEAIETNVEDVISTSSTKTSVLLPTTTKVPQYDEGSSNFDGTLLGSDLISEQDILSIDVYKNDDLTRTVQVDNNGDINYPLLSKVHVKGLTPSQLAQKIKQGLEKDFIVEAFVSVYIKQTNKNKFVIEGAVNKAGVYLASGKTTILQAIAHAGGLSKDADQHHATLLRKTPKGEIVRDTIDIAAIKRGKLSDFLLMRGDRIIVQKGIYNRVTISGAVNNPGIFPLTEGMTVLQTIALAGGFNRMAHKDHVVVLRRNLKDRSFKKYSVNLQDIRSGIIVDPEIQADDRIVVVESRQSVLLDELTRILTPLGAVININNKL